MVKRAARGPFPSLHVFPGGKLDETDSTDTDSTDLCEGLDDAEASVILGVAQGGIRYWLACVRECFEETGILLATEADGSKLELDDARRDRLAEYRRRLNDGESVLTQMCREEGLRLPLQNIAYSAHWITPKIEPKRFDTRFFVALMPEHQVSVHDGLELVDTRWIRLSEVLAKSDAGEINLIMPTIENLRTLMDGDTAADIVAKRSAASDIPTILPKFLKIGGEWVGLLPGDPRYDQYED